MQHKDFILSPITNIVDEATSAISLLGDGMHTNPLMNYLFHSVFMQMTGSQEQKLKCVCWEVATIDYEFRYKWMNKKQEGKIGECSDFEDKTKVYELLLKQLGEEYKSGINTMFTEEKTCLLDDAKACVEEFGKQSIFKPAEVKYLDFLSFSSKMQITDIMTKTGLFGGTQFLGMTLKDVYTDKLYRQRNRNAHNTLSYQTNTPSFAQLYAKDSFYDNYFIYFYMLALIDGMIRILFEQWCNKI